MPKFAALLKKLETDNEEGLTNGQLMLTNHDLKPGIFSAVTCIFFNSTIFFHDMSPVLPFPAIS